MYNHIIIYNYIINIYKLCINNVESVFVVCVYMVSRLNPLSFYISYPIRRLLAGRDLFSSLQSTVVPLVLCLAVGLVCLFFSMWFLWE